MDEGNQAECPDSEDVSPEFQIGGSPRRGDLRVLQILWNGGEDKLLS